MPIGDHERRSPDSKPTFTPEGSDSDARPLDTPEQSPARPKKTKRGGPEAARHLANDNEEEVSESESEPSGDGEATMKHRMSVSSRSQESTRKRLIVGGRKRQNVPHEGDGDPHNGIRRNVRGPDNPHKTGAQVQETNEGPIDSPNLHFKDTRECCSCLFPDVPTS